VCVNACACVRGRVCTEGRERGQGRERWLGEVGLAREHTSEMCVCVFVVSNRPPTNPT
jgi:hypothetical protein